MAQFQDGDLVEFNVNARRIPPGGSDLTFRGRDAYPSLPPEWHPAQVGQAYTNEAGSTVYRIRATSGPYADLIAWMPADAIRHPTRP